MFPLLFIAFSMQAQITEADVPLILEAAAEYVTADTVEFNGQSLEGRPVFIAGENARAAFGKVAPSVALMESGAAQSYTVVEEDSAIRCTEQRDPTSCEVVENGVLLTISQIEPDTRPNRGRDAHLVHMLVQWNDQTSAAQQPKILIVARSADGWEIAGTIFMEY